MDENQRCTLEVVGELNGETAIELIERVRDAIESRGHREIEVDLSGVREIDASGVWGLIEAKSLGGGAVRVTGHSLAVMNRLNRPHPGHDLRAANDSHVGLIE
jgi:anti-anti-sigma regulatory factor